jgi:glycosyltransferase involved in cell wall biosynthesis
MSVTLTVVVPVYNEASALALFWQRVSPILEAGGLSWTILFVDDGSRDDTFTRIQQLAKEHPDRVRGIRLARNFGKERALAAGLDRSTADVTIIMDVDLQDPPELIPEMLAAWRNGAAVVMTARRGRGEDSWPKKITARFFYKIYNAIARVPIEENASDFCLLTKPAVEALRQLRERCRFTKGLLAWIGFTPVHLYYDRPARSDGTASRWRPLGLWRFALDGLTSFSTRPLHAWTYIGLIIASISFLFGASILVRTVLFGTDLPGYASLMVVITFLGGVQLVSLGVIGEYLGRIYAEVKGRPLYLVREEC